MALTVICPRASAGRITAIPVTPAPIIIGEYGSMTGDQSIFGVNTDNGVRLAIDEVNASGGINGRQLSLVVRDDEGKLDKVVLAAENLVRVARPTAVIGEVASGLSAPAAIVFNDAKVPMISPSSTNPRVTTVGPYIFRACFIDPFQGTAAATFAVTQLQAKRAAVFWDVSNQYSVGLTVNFEHTFRASGGKIVCERNYAMADTSFEASLKSIKAASPDIIYVPGYYANAGPIAVQCRKLGITAPLIGGDGWDSPRLIDGAGGPGGALEGSYFTDHYAADNPSSKTQAFVEAYHAKYGAVPDALAALGYDAAGILIAALKSTAPVDDYGSARYRAKLRDAIAATAHYAGVTGNITINERRNAVKPAVVLQVHGAGYVYKSTINP